MEAFRADRFLHLARSLVNTTAVAVDNRGGLVAGYRDIIIRDFRELLEECRFLGLPVACRQIEDALKVLELGRRDSHDSLAGTSAERSANMISTTIETEMALRLFFFIPPDRAKYYEPDEPIFGTEVQTKFPAGIYELDEAAKCMAFRRSTATIFHLMRLMEIALGAVSKCLAIPPPTRGGERNWGSILSKIKAETDRRNAASGWPTAGDRELFAELYVSLDAVRVAWRNATMHVENKYSTEEAEHIFVAVRHVAKAFEAFGVRQLGSFLRLARHRRSLLLAHAHALITNELYSLAL
jgi:hypothetical protein